MSEDKIEERVQLLWSYTPDVAAAMLEGAGRTLERVSRDVGQGARVDLEAVKAAGEVCRWVIASERTRREEVTVQTYVLHRGGEPFEVEDLDDAIAFVLDQGETLADYCKTWWVEQHAYDAWGEPIGEVAVYDADVTAAYRAAGGQSG